LSRAVYTTKLTAKTPRGNSGTVSKYSSAKLRRASRSVVRIWRPSPNYPLASWRLVRYGKLDVAVAVGHLQIGFAGLDVDFAINSDPRVSWDGKQLAVAIVDEASAIGICDLSGISSMRRLTLEGSAKFPRWSPDDRQVAFQSSMEGKNGIFLQNSDGTGMPERLTTESPTDPQIPWSWSPDGKRFAYTVCKNLMDCGIFTIAVAGERRVETFTDLPGAAQYNAAFSRDGRWMA
jgi:hypothetical protein